MVLSTRRGFHGKKGIAGAVTGDESDPDRDPRVRFISFPTEECGDVSQRRQPLDLTPFRAELEALADQFGDRIGTLITEPYLGGGGSFHPQPEYVRLLERFCRDRDAVFIFDEIQSNFGRTGPLYAFSHYGVEPDLVCLGKGLGNGIPVSAAVGRADIFKSLKFGEASDTFSANPLACAAVIATLDAFENSDVLDRGQGCVWGIECAAIGMRAAEQVANDVVRACYLGDREGRAIHLLGPLAGRVIRISPPLILDGGEAEEYLDAMFRILIQVRDAV
jgi:4-aminobutyrate aminotransferase-like enzyme